VTIGHIFEERNLDYFLNEIGSARLFYEGNLKKIPFC
jgi:hypothetical protein